MLDHCSLTWGTDENLTIYASSQKIYNISAQNCIISEGLRKEDASRNDHAAGSITGSETRADLVYNISIHRNLLSHNQFRNPYVKNKNARVINNTVYDWEYWGMMIRGGIAIDIIGNKFKIGQGYLGENWTTDRGIRYTSPGDNGGYGVPGEPSIYIEGNADDYFPNPEQDNWNMIEQTTNDFQNKRRLDIKFRRYTQLTFEKWPVTVYPTDSIAQKYLPTVGASHQLTAQGEFVLNQDLVDQRIIKQYFTHTGGYVSSPDEVGGYPNLSKGIAYVDSDHDGMSDVWEKAQGFDINNASDRNNDADGDGYTNVEEFLNGTLPIPLVSGNPGIGLAYTFYDNKTLSGLPLLTGTDPTVDFDWQNAGPAPSLPKDNFSVRWSGQVQAKYSEEYTFYTQADDGTRLWVNGKLLIDDWTNHAVREKAGKITLQAGEKYDIKLEHFENKGKAVCKLLWKSTSQNK